VRLLFLRLLTTSRRVPLLPSLALLLFLGAAIAGQEPPSTPGDGNAAPGAPAAQGQTTKDPRWKWAFSIRNRTGFRLDQPRVLQMSRTFFDLKANVRLSDNWRATAELRAHIDPVERLGYPDGLWVDPRQLTIDGKIGRTELRLGMQQMVWGEADGLRVLDVINPLDYREFILEDFLDSRRPLWAARTDTPIAGGSLQLVLVPYFVPGRLPAATDEFGLGVSFGSALIAAAVGADARVDALPTSRPGYRLSSTQFGARYRRSIRDWDITGNYFYGWEDIPTNYIDSFGISGDGLRVTLGPRYDRKEVIGATGATNFGPVVVRLEAGWNRNKPVPTSDPSGMQGYLKSGQFSGVVGADYSPASWLWVSGQYFLQMTSAPQRALLFPRYNNLASFFVRTNFLREKLRPELFVLTGLNQKQYMIRPRVVRSLGDHFSLAIGADFLGGSEITAFGHFARNDRAILELKWMW
jgi:hypothetical protein